MQKGGQASEPPSTSSPAVDLKTKSLKRQAPPDWLIGDSAPEEVRVQDSWADLQADADNLSRTMWLRSRIGVCLESRYETFP